MRPIHFVTALCFIPLLVHGQSADVRGVVADSTTGERIPFANVLIKELAKGTASNGSGFYLIPKVPFGTYEMLVSSIGYRQQSKRVVVSGTEAVAVNFRLAPQAVETEGVEVTGRKRPEQLDVQTSVHTMDRAELKRIPMATQGDVLRSIAILPGIVTTSDVNAQFYVRGGSSDQNLILIDGMRLYNPFHAFGLFSTLNPDLINTAEVYTGAFPSEFGGRLSSVINLTSRDGNASDFVARSNINFLSSSINFEGPISKNVQTILSARKSIFSGTFKNFLRVKVPLSFYDVFFKTTIKNPESPNKYSIQALISNDDLLASEPTDPTYNWSSRSFGAEANLPAGDRLFWHVSVSLGQFSQSRAVPSSSALIPVDNTVKEGSLWANLTYYTDSKDLYFFGFEFNVPSFDYNFVNLLGQPGHVGSSTPQISSWLHYQALGPVVSADLGLRAQVMTLFRGKSLKNAVLPRANVSVNLFEDWKAKASYGRFTQEAITITNEDDILPIFVPWIAVPENLDPERADHYVLGVEGNVTPTLSTTFTAFYKDYSSLVVYNRDKIDAGDPDYINATGESYGGEALVRYSHPIIDLYAAYTLTWVKVNLNGFIYSPRYDRRHTVNLLGSVHPVKNLDVSLRWEFGSGIPFTQTVGFYDKLHLGNGFPDPFYNETGTPQTLYGPKNAARLPTYHRMDLSASYQFELFSFLRGSAGISLINLYDRKNIFYFERSTGQRVNMLGFFPTANISLEFLP